MLESGGDVTVAASVNLGLVKSEWSSMVDQQVRLVSIGTAGQARRRRWLTARLLIANREG